LAAKPCAISRPIPRLLPVTKAHFPRMSMLTPHLLPDGRGIVKAATAAIGAIR
jgi:hypothetical protein